MEEKKTKPTTQPEADNKHVPARYIRQPYPISAIQADLSTQQIRILVSMMQSIQDGVQKMFERGPVNGQMNLFPEMQDDHVNIDFKFSDVASRPDAYRDVERVAKKFMGMVFRYEDKQKGEVNLSHFVDEVTYPSRYQMQANGKKRHDKIRFSFTKKQAQVVFNFTMYSRYLLNVAMSAKSKHTARLYMLITSARGFERDDSGLFHWYVGYEELRRILGCDEKDEHDHWYRKTLKLYKQFKFAVLRTAQRELKELADNGKSDCWFEFLELPENFEHEPKRFDFLVHLTDINKTIEIKDDNKDNMREW